MRGYVKAATVDILVENTELDMETLPDTTRKLCFKSNINSADTRWNF